MFCRSCGENIPVDSVFCPHCGKNLLEIATPKTSGSNAGFSFFGKTRKKVPVHSIEDRWQEDADEKAEAEEANEEEPLGPAFDWSRLERIGLTRVFWTMGLVFAAVGFVVGISGNTAQAMVWILFGLALLIAAPQAIGRHDGEQPEVEEVSE
ncbi:MAG: zinc ribbon domain-containing protein [Sulfobacillus acidophilus]|uniref:Zinc ribbon domain-containing protein n=1 Tax=Sulfobacillus acidophilus TaxID=53633 RepID=A0A2T2WER5_9FIRM|nr:MAG: zinc ribbon domain-containing protein [Sulfobacillus acidophilus]